MARGEAVWQTREYGESIADALRELAVERLVLTIHDASFPAGDDDVGRGTPGSQAGRELLRLVRQLGFTGVQLGPEGATSPGNASPYDSTLFSRDPLSIALAPLCSGDELQQARDNLPQSTASRAEHAAAWRRQEQALKQLHQRLAATRAADVAAFTRQAGEWLERDARFAALTAEPGREREAIDFYCFCQLLAHEQHAAVRAHAASLGLRLYGDVQIGFSPRDAWAYRSLFVPGYRLGAPPSRTNPEGQPWGYPVLDPAQYGGGAARLVAARVSKLLDEFDGLRIDHPHGLVDPWVYRDDDADPLRAVQAGARLLSSPDVPEHPALARHAVARPEQLDRAQPRWADDWVRALDEAQVARYATLFDLLVAAARAHGLEASDLLCEVLSTWPHPLRRVMARDRLGRFVVTQKADLDDAADVYRAENAQPEDWIMVGNHDTPPIWVLADQWERSARACHLAERLQPDPTARPAFAQMLERQPGALATAMFAELFTSPARNVSVFFADLFGLKSIYNVPGTISDDNWSLRVPPDYQARYREDIAEYRALNLPRALAWALAARPSASRATLIARLDRLASVR